MKTLEWAGGLEIRQSLDIFTLGRWDDGTNESSTKRLIIIFFHDFLQNTLQKGFQFILLFFFIKLQK